MKLTEAQVRFFKTFGYLALPKLFSADEIAWISDGFEVSIQRNGGGKHDGTKRTMFGAPIEHTEQMCALLDDPRVTGALGGVLGEDFSYCSGDGNYYSGDTGWHPDGNWGELFAVKMAFYLDPVGPETGCLRVIPGSQNPDHFVRKHQVDPNKSMERFGVAPKDFPGNVPLASRPGDVVMFNHDTYHSAWGGGARRRMFTLNNIRHARDQRDLDLAHKYLKVHTPGAGNFDTGAGMFMPLMLDSAGPERMRHLSQPAAIHDELFPQFARKREPVAV